MTFQTMLTKVGLAKISNALALEKTVKLVQMAVGDGGGTPTSPTQDQTTLVNEVYRANLSRLETDPDNPAYVIAEMVVPSTEGGWYVREVAIYDEAGDMIAVANFPDTYKPTALEGSTRDLVIRLYIEVVNAGAVELRVDPAVILATRDWVATNFIQGNSTDDLDEGEENLYFTEERARNAVAGQMGGASSIFEQPHFLTITDQDAHRGLHGAVIPLENKWIIVWREASSHFYDASGVLKAADTVNQGRTLTNIRTIYSELNVDVMHPAVAVMANGRIGMLVARILAQGSPPGSPAFVYSDDGGETWNSRVLTGITGVASQDFMHRYPASAGGDDSQGFWMSGYVGFQGEDLHAVYTTDNGETWSSAAIVESSSNDFLSEPTVTRLGDSNRWVMVVRRNANPATGAASDSMTATFYQSTDMMQWDGPYDTQQVLGRNPPHIAYNNGRVEWFAFSREFIGRPIPIGGHDTDSLIWQSADAEVLWETRQGWSGWEIVTPLREPVGYLNTFKTDGQWFAIFAHNENRPGLYCQLAIMSQREIFDDPGITIDSVQPVTVSPAAEIRKTKISAATGTRESIGAGVSRTIFDIDGAVELLGGIISGPPDGKVTLVVDGSPVFSGPSLPFDDSAGNQSMVFPFYPIKSRKNMSLELLNAGAAAGRYSWRIYLREPNTTNTASELV